MARRSDGAGCACPRVPKPGIDGIVDTPTKTQRPKKVQESTTLLSTVGAWLATSRRVPGSVPMALRPSGPGARLRSCARRRQRAGSKQREDSPQRSQRSQRRAQRGRGRGATTGRRVASLTSGDQVDQESWHPFNQRRLHAAVTTMIGGSIHPSLSLRSLRLFVRALVDALDFGVCIQPFSGVGGARWH